MAARSSTVVAGLGAALSLTLASPVGAEGARFGIDVQGHVPVICQARVDAATVSAGAGETSLGHLNEFCNSGAGYSVYADYSEELSNAVLVIDGKAVPLSESGSVLISTSATAAITSRELSLKLPDGVTGGSISFRIVAA
jgi:hypothetical protein